MRVLLIISIHAPIRGRRLKSQPRAASCLYFNPRPHTGATYFHELEKEGLLISIHAPIRGRQRPDRHFDFRRYFNPRPHTGATRYLTCVEPQFGISIHAPIRGRHDTAMEKWKTDEFQSTPPYGGDIRGPRRWPTSSISIHAPIRGRLWIHIILFGVFLFQSTPPYGGDWWFAGLSGSWRYFNPRPHTGATSHHTHLDTDQSISIHAPIRGRPRRIASPERPPQFQSTPPYGGDRY